MALKSFCNPKMHQLQALTGLTAHHFSPQEDALTTPIVQTSGFRWLLSTVAVVPMHFRRELRQSKLPLQPVSAQFPEAAAAHQ